MFYLFRSIDNLNKYVYVNGYDKIVCLQLLQNYYSSSETFIYITKFQFIDEIELFINTNDMLDGYSLETYKIFIKNLFLNNLY